jgi:hypothetical protein
MRAMASRLHCIAGQFSPPLVNAPQLKTQKPIYYRSANNCNCSQHGPIRAVNVYNNKLCIATGNAVRVQTVDR